MFATLPNTVVNPLNKPMPHPLVRLVIDLIIPFSSDAPTIHVAGFDEIGQVVGRIRSKRTLFLNNNLLYRAAAPKDHWDSGTKRLHSLKHSGQIQTSAQRKKRRLKSPHPIPQPDFDVEKTLEDVWPTESTFTR